MAKGREGVTKATKARPRGAAARRYARFTRLRLCRWCGKRSHGLTGALCDQLCLFPRARCGLAAGLVLTPARESSPCPGG